MSLPVFFLCGFDTFLNLFPLAPFQAFPDNFWRELTDHRGSCALVVHSY
jgi:hypothetical protein